MGKRDDALDAIRRLGLPRGQRNERSCLTLLALAALRETDSWADVGRPSLRVVDVMAWMREHYGKDYAPNTRETIRRGTLHQFEQARLVDRNPDDPARPTNSGATVYRLTSEAAETLRRYGRRDFAGRCEAFVCAHGRLADVYRSERDLLKVPVSLPGGGSASLSPGAHNELQRSIVEEFAPRFAPGAALLYLGDTARKTLIVDAAGLAELNIPAPGHDKLPDVVIHDRARGWLFLIEAVVRHGPVSPKRRAELEASLTACPAGRIYVTAFRDFAGFKKHAADIVWESEVWIAESPDHMIHFNGGRFLGPPSRDERSG